MIPFFNPTLQGTWRTIYSLYGLMGNSVKDNTVDTNYPMAGAGGNGGKPPIPPGSGPTALPSGGPEPNKPIGGGSMTNPIQGGGGWFGGHGEEKDRFAARFMKSALNGMLTGAIAAAVVMLTGNKDEYEQLSENVRTGNIVVPWNLGYNRFMRIPLTQDIFSRVMYTAGQLMTFDAAGDPLSLDVKAFAFSIAADSIKTDTIATPILDVMQNKTWYGSTLVPTSKQGLPVTQQANDTTTSAAVYASRALAASPLHIGLSPIAIDYIAQQYSGVLGQVFMPMFSSNATLDNASDQQNPLVRGLTSFTDTVYRRFSTDPAYSNDVTDSYYSNKNFITAINTSINKTGKSDSLNPYMTEE